MDYRNQNNRQNNKPWEKKPVNNDLPAGYLVGGYFNQVNGENVLKKEYIVTYPREIARNLSSAGDKNKPAQLRKFYEASLSLKQNMQRKGSEYDADTVAWLKTYVEYAKNRQTITELFYKFINQNIDAIKTREEYFAFVKHFEAVIAYLPKGGR